jgi:tetratricopeptide (TPR) repeat protein
LQINDGPAEVESLLACCYSEMGEIQKAEKLFQDLSAHFPAYGIFHVNLGRAYLRNGRLRDAAQEYEKAFGKENNRYYNLLFEAGSIYMEFKDYTKAIACFEKFYEKSPDSFEILTKIGTCYLAQGKVNRAQEKYQQALRIQPNYEAARLGLEKIEEIERWSLSQRRNPSG